MKIRSIAFYKSLIVCLMLSLMQVFIIQKAIIIYIPLLFSILFSFVYGLMSPKYGWVLAIFQIAIIISGYWILDSAGFIPTKPQQAQFVSHIIIFPSFVASFLAAFLFEKKIN
jgi:hypothetical protein